MPKDTLQLLKDYNIQFSTEHHHCSPGWVQVHCPFCNDNNFHLGIPLSSPKIVNCWRCGRHTMYETIKELLHCSGSEVYQILQKYGEDSYLSDKKKVENTKVLKFPVGTVPLNSNHRKYLEDRGFDTDVLIQEWGLLGTGHLGENKHRIIIPIYYKNIPVSYTGRDITGKSELRYKTCSTENEVRHHKHCLYGIDKVRGDSVIVVEGPTDVWRIGPGSVATLGITWTKEQVILLSQFKKVSILYDPEPFAQEQARRLAHELSWLSVESEVLQQSTLEDPAMMNEQDVRKVKDLINE